MRRAREVTAQATVRFEAGDYGAAAAAFLEAYSLLDGDARGVALLNNVAVSYERMFRYDLALTYYERYLRLTDPGDADRAEVEQIVAGLRRLLGQVRIRTNVPARVWIGPDRQLSAPAEVWVPAGTHVVEARAPGYDPVRRKIQIAPQSIQTLDLTLTPLPQYKGIHSRYFWTGIGLTGVALITGTAFGAKAVKLHRDAQGRLDDGLVVQSDNEDIQRLQRSADISFGTAALLGVSTLVLFFVSDFERSAPDARGSIRMAPRIGPGNVGLCWTARLQ